MQKIRMLVCSILITWVGSCSSFDVVLNNNSSPETIKRIAILNIRNLSSKDNENLKDYLGMELLRYGYDVVERSILDSIIEEQSLGAQGLVDEKTAAKIGKLAGADTVVIGSGIYSDGKLEMLLLKLVNTQTSSVMVAAKSERKMVLGEAAKQAIQEIYQRINKKP